MLLPTPIMWLRLIVSTLQLIQMGRRRRRLTQLLLLKFSPKESRSSLVHSNKGGTGRRVLPDDNQNKRGRQLRRPHCIGSSRNKRMKPTQISTGQLLASTRADSFASSSSAQ